MRARGLRVGAGCLVAAVLLAACGGDDGDGDGSGGDAGGTLTVWTVEDLAERVQAQEQILAAFTEATGTPAELVAVAEDQLTTVLTSAAAADDLPDVIGALSLTGVNRLLTDDLVDPEAAAAVVEALGADTFSEQALELTRSGEDQLAVPSDGWAQLLFYRSDLFEQAGLDPPETYEAIMAAAQQLDADGRAGIVAATAPADSFTQQTFEHIALANGCQLVGDDGGIALGSDECAEAFEFYSDLMSQYSVPGNQDADTTRASYFAGQAAMVIWSSFLLDELAGLRNDALPTCPECQGPDPFLAENTGIVTAIQGPSGAEPAAYGEIVSWAILRDADEAATEFVEFMMSDGYVDWLAIAPEGKVPTRNGTAEDPEAFIQAWQGLEAGVDTKAPLSEFYSAETLEDIATSPQNFDRWGLSQGEGELAGAVAGQFIVPELVSELITSGGDPAEAASSAAEQAEQLAGEVGS